MIQESSNDWEEVKSQDLMKFGKLSKVPAKDNLNQDHKINLVKQLFIKITNFKSNI